MSRKLEEIRLNEVMCDMFMVYKSTLNLSVIVF